MISRGQRYKLVTCLDHRQQIFPRRRPSRADVHAAGVVQSAARPLQRAFRQKDEENIANLYRANGFRDVKVTSTVDRNYQGKPEQIAVTVNIEEGPQWFVDNVAIDGITQLRRNDLIPAARVRSRAAVCGRESGQRSQSIAHLLLRARISRADSSSPGSRAATPHHVNVIYTVTEGDRQLRPRRHHHRSDDTTRQSLVDKNMTLKAGDPLSAIEQTEIQKRFYDLGIFASVDTAIQNPDGDTDHKYILYNFEEANRYSRRPWRWRPTGAASARRARPTCRRPAAATGFSPEVSLDVSRLNFLGLGHTVSLHGLYSNRSKSAGPSIIWSPRFRNAEGRNMTFTLSLRQFAECAHFCVET